MLQTLGACVRDPPARLLGGLSISSRLRGLRVSSGSCPTPWAGAPTSLWPREAKDPINTSASPAYVTAPGAEGAALRRQADLRKILIIRRLPAGWRGEGLHGEKSAAMGCGCSVSGQLRAAGPRCRRGRARCRRAPSCRSAAPGAQPARGGLPTRRENLLFGIWPLLSAIRRPLKMKREVAAARRASHRMGCCRPELGRAQPAGRDTGGTHRCPESLCEDRDG